MQSRKRVLITGSKGYIGQHLVKMLSNYSDVYNVVEFEGDINDNLTFYSTDTIVHLAALVRVNESITKPTQYYKNNLNGTINLLNRIVFNNFIFASTGTASNPVNPYAFSKRACEDVVKEHCIKKESNYTIFRFYNVTGTGGFSPTNPDGLLYNLMKAVNTGEFNLHGIDYNTKDGTCVRDYLHVNEVCESIIKAIDTPSNSIENLGTGRGYTVREIIDAFKLSNNVDFMINELPRREGDLEYMILDNVSNYMEQKYNLLDLLNMKGQNL